MDKDAQTRIESILNRKDGSLPFGYFAPSEEGRVTWNCGHDQQGRIVSVFANDNGMVKDRVTAILPSMTEALMARDALIEAKWQPLKAPEITVKYADGEERPLSRKQKRYLASKIKKMSKKNPFDENKDENNNDKDEDGMTLQ